MKNTPYTIPEGFFEKAEANAVAAASAISRRRKLVAGSAFGCLALALAFLLWQPERSVSVNAVASSANYSDEEILETYDYDIFLNNHF